jgi:hypothetical protein
MGLMKQEYLGPGIATQWIRFDLGVAGLLSAIVCMILLLVFVNLEYWQLFVGAITFGLCVATAFHLCKRSTSTSSDDRIGQEYPHPGITMNRIRFGAGFAGLIFTLGCMLLFLAGLPLLWYPFAGALVLGVGIAAVLHFIRR